MLPSMLADPHAILIPTKTYTRTIAVLVEQRKGLLELGYLLIAQVLCHAAFVVRRRVRAAAGVVLNRAPKQMACVTGRRGGGQAWDVRRTLCSTGGFVCTAPTQRERSLAHSFQCRASASTSPV